MVIADDEDVAMKPGVPIRVDDPFDFVVPAQSIQVDYSAHSEVTQDDLKKLVKAAKRREQVTRQRANDAVIIAKGAAANADGAVEDLLNVATRADEARRVAHGVANKQSEFIDNYNQLTVLMGRIERYMQGLKAENAALKAIVGKLEEKVRRHERIFDDQHGHD